MTIIFQKDDKIIKIDINLHNKQINNKLMPCLSITGQIGFDTYGQCKENINKILKDDKTWQVIYRIWKKYHLNNFHAGTIEQEKNLKKHGIYGDKYDYKKACEYLKKINMYEVIHEGKLYKYGHAWLYHPIPKYTINKIKTILKQYNNKIIKL